LVRQFIADPLHKDSSSLILLSERLKRQINRLFVAELAPQVDELAFTAREIPTLQAQIDKF
jgi:hypothetical protein